MNNSICISNIYFTNILGMQDIILSIKNKDILLIIDNSSIERWNLEPFITSLKISCNIILISQVNPNPTQDDIHNSLLLIKKNNINTIIVIGGGSAIDLAKGISAFYDPYKQISLEEITTNIVNKKYIENNFIDIIAVPTTAGTGSELTQWATIWDINKFCKYSLDHDKLKPKMAIIVPELTLSLPSIQTLSTGFDSLSHAIEAYWSKQTTPLVQDLSTRAIQIILRNLKKTIENPQDINLREQMCRASVLSGLAFSQTRTTACHSISYALTLKYGIAHGLAVAMTLNGVAEINKSFFKGSDELFNLFETFGGLQYWIEDTSKNIVTMKLSKFGIETKDIEYIANESFSNERMGNNPVQLTLDDVIYILNKAL